jgi:hypothetical protein
VLRYIVAFVFIWLSAASLISAFCMSGFGRDRPAKNWLATSLIFVLLAGVMLAT